MAKTYIQTNFIDYAATQTDERTPEIALPVCRPMSWVLSKGFARVINLTGKCGLAEGDWIAIYATQINRPEQAARYESFLTGVEVDVNPPTGIVAIARHGGFVEDSDDPFFLGFFGALLEDVIELREPFLPQEYGSTPWVLGPSDRIGLAEAIRLTEESR